MSLCDTCRDPGACCRDLTLYRHNGQLVTVWDDEGPAGFTSENELPFEPIRKVGQWTVPDGDADGNGGRAYSAWAFRCTALGEDGRCTVYDRRPQLCRDYEPGSSPLCVMHNPATPLEKAVE